MFQYPVLSVSSVSIGIARGTHDIERESCSGWSRRFRSEVPDLLSRSSLRSERSCDHFLTNRPDARTYAHLVWVLGRCTIDTTSAPCIYDVDLPHGPPLWLRHQKERTTCLHHLCLAYICRSSSVLSLPHHLFRSSSPRSLSNPPRTTPSSSQLRIPSSIPSPQNVRPIRPTPVPRVPRRICRDSRGHL